jgi:hypothetical protein
MIQSARSGPREDALEAEAAQHRQRVEDEEWDAAVAGRAQAQNE